MAWIYKKINKFKPTGVLYAIQLDQLQQEQYSRTEFMTIGCWQSIRDIDDEIAIELNSKTMIKK